MSRYRTQIIVSSDRYVCLQLPADWPEGPAIVTVEDPAGLLASGSSTRVELEHLLDDDVEWWDEFEEPEDPAGP